MPLPKNKNATQLGFKVGDKFRVVDEEADFEVGEVITLIEDDDTRCPYFRNEAGEEDYESFEYLEVLNKTLDHLQIGDVVVWNGGERKVLAVLAPGVYALSRIDQFDRADDIYTAGELKEYNYTIKDVPADIEELTMEEVCRELGREVKIKKS